MTIRNVELICSIIYLKLKKLLYTRNPKVLNLDLKLILNFDLDTADNMLSVHFMLCVQNCFLQGSSSTKCMYCSHRGTQQICAVGTKLKSMSAKT